MARELWLMRHGKAERFDGIEDYDRVLKKRGKQAAKLVGNWLNQQQIKPDWVFSSPATRAIGTAKLVCAALGIDAAQIQQDKRLYDEGLVRMKSVVADCAADHQRVLVVAHNPELEELLVYLLEPSQLPYQKKLLPTAGLVRLSIPDDWSQLDRGCAQLISITSPQQLIETQYSND